MASPLKKLKTNQPSTELPHDLIFMCILPRLSYKSLSKFKCVNKAWQEIISNDAKFARDQSLHPSPISCGAVFSDCRGNKFEFLNTFGSPIGIDPHHNLLTDPKVECKRILASSCGLLCVLFKYDKGDSHSLYIGNVATGEGDVIPTVKHEESSIGLAFDPSIEPNCYKIVSPLRDLKFKGDQTVEYKFLVYSSQTLDWVLSTETISVISNYFCPGKPVSLRNIVYWHCYEYAISFDPWKDVANYIQLPMPETSNYHQELGTCNECITCTRLDKKNIAVYVFEEREKRWERKYRVDLDMVIDANHDVFKEFCHMMKTRSGPSFGKLYQAYYATPFSYDGGDVLFFRVRTKKLEFVFSYDLKSGKARKFCDFGVVGRCYRFFNHADHRIFKYHNSMVKMPDKLPTIP